MLLAITIIKCTMLVTSQLVAMDRTLIVKWSQDTVNETITTTR